MSLNPFARRTVASSKDLTCPLKHVPEVFKSHKRKSFKVFNTHSCHTRTRVVIKLIWESEIRVLRTGVLVGASLAKLIVLSIRL